MSSTQRSNLIFPAVLAEEIQKGIAGVNVFSRSKAVVINPSLQNGRARVGANITVPYFESIGKAQMIPEGGAITPKRLVMSGESGEVVHLGDAVSINALAEAVRVGGADIYQQARDMILAGIAAKAEDIITQRLAARAVAASMVYDGSADNVTPTAIVGAMKKFGDELTFPAAALWLMNSSVMWDIAQLTDSTGKPLYTQGAGQAPSSINNIPIAPSDKSDLSLGTTPATYYSLLVKEGAVAMWVDPDISVEIDRDSLADDTLLVYHMYCVIHAYGTMAGRTMAGVAGMKTRAST